MKNQLSTGFLRRQYMEHANFEIYYYNDLNPANVSMHLHNHYEFYLFLEGAIDYNIEQSIHHLEPGDFLLIPPGVRHHPIVLNASCPYRRFVLWLSTPYYETICRAHPDFSYTFDEAARQKKYHYHADFLQFQAMQGQLIGMIEESQSQKAFHELNTHLLIASFLVHLNRQFYEQLHQISPRYENVLYLNICDYINNHLEEDLSLDKLASFFYVSKYHVSHVFKEHMGISPHRYILKKRLQASKNGILSGIPLNDIFHKYGFNDYSSFYRAFKKEFGMSPSDFKTQHSPTEFLN